MKKIMLSFGILLGLLVACQKTPKTFKYQQNVALDKVSPIGFDYDGKSFWIADGDHNRLVKTDLNGKTLEVQDGFKRPMHLAIDQQKVYVPEYGSDTIQIVENQQKKALELSDSLDAPAGIDVIDKEIAIADFYNHRILYFNGSQWLSFGKEGKKQGELYYPTDVQITSNKIYVADAYNNRVQVFDKQGKSLQTIGFKEGINAATGIFIEDDIYVTDFENNRILIFDQEGNLLQELKEGLNKPTDLLILNDQLFVCNYKGQSLSIFKR